MSDLCVTLIGVAVDIGERLQPYLYRTRTVPTVYLCRLVAPAIAAGIIAIVRVPAAASVAADIDADAWTPPTAPSMTAPVATMPMTMATMPMPMTTMPMPTATVPMPMPTVPMTTVPMTRKRGGCGNEQYSHYRTYERKLAKHWYLHFSCKQLPMPGMVSLGAKKKKSRRGRPARDFSRRLPSIRSTILKPPSRDSTVHGGGKRLIAWEPVLRDVSLYDVPFCRVRLDASPRRAVLS